MINQKTADVAKHLFNELDIDWTGEAPDQGMNRKAWSWEETNAMRTLYGFAHDELGMDVYEDLAGNVYMISENRLSKQYPVRMAGSHVDAVKNGGRYDGPAGVIAPLAALYQAKLDGTISAQPSVITIWRNEESPWLNQFAVGSKFATGVLSDEFLRTAEHTAYNMTLLDLMNDRLDLRGNDLLKKILSDDPKLIDPLKIEGLVETHIEQGSELEIANAQLGIVTSIRGNVRFPDMIDFYGVTGHSGTVPQNQRKDANLAMAIFIVECNKIFEGYEGNADIVWSYPEAHNVGSKSSNIPGHARLRPEVRSTDPAILTHVAHNFACVAQRVEQKTGVKIVLNKVNTQQPVIMSSDIQNQLSCAAISAGIQTLKMPSGAGHDVQVGAEAGINSGLIFIHHGNNGVSHRPDEILGRTPDDNPFTTSSDFACAVELNRAWMMGSQSSHKSMETGFSKDILNRGARRLTF
jgi:N-carbamoyl-L-amino-acid hydrolase